MPGCVRTGLVSLAQQHTRTQQRSRDNLRAHEEDVVGRVRVLGKVRQRLPARQHMLLLHALRVLQVPACTVYQAIGGVRLLSSVWWSIAGVHWTCLADSAGTRTQPAPAAGCRFRARPSAQQAVVRRPVRVCAL